MKTSDRLPLPAATRNAAALHDERPERGEPRAEHPAKPPCEHANPPLRHPQPTAEEHPRLRVDAH